MLKRLDAIEELLARIAEALPLREYITVDDICHELNCGRDYIRSRPWILPAFGIPDLDGRPRRWRLDHWWIWKADLGAREQAWIQMSDARRREIVEAAA